VNSKAYALPKPEMYNPIHKWLLSSNKNWMLWELLSNNWSWEM
jgi:hypothetical protein